MKIYPLSNGHSKKIIEKENPDFREIDTHLKNELHTVKCLIDQLKIS